MRAANFLIAGAPGSGKTSVGEALANKGYLTIDTDNYPGLTTWINRETHLPAAPPDTGMTKEWLSQHDYLWDEELLKELLNKSKDGLILYGSSSNQENLLHLFDTVFLLKLDPVTIIERLKNRVGNGKYGKTQDERDHVLTWLEAFQDRYESRGVIIINAKQPLMNVVDSILRHLER